MPDTQSSTSSLPFQCRHIFTDGRRCGANCLRAEPFCYYHHTTRGRAARRAQQSADASAFRDRLSTFTLPLPEDRSAIQLAIGEIMLRIAAGELDTRRAGLLLYALQIASSNLPKATVSEPLQTVEDTVLDPELGLLAPESRFAAAPREKTLDEIFMAEWNRPSAAESITQSLGAPSQTVSSVEVGSTPSHPRHPKPSTSKPPPSLLIPIP